MIEKLVSIVVAVFNQQDFVVETVTSVLNQTYSNLEVIAVDDGSSDESVAKLLQIKDSRLTVVPLEHAGEASCKNSGFQRCVGDFVGFIDADDIWAPTKVESHVEALTNNQDACLAYSFTSFVDEKGFALYDEPPYATHADWHRELLKNNFMKSGSNAIHTRKSLIESGVYDPNCKILIDWDLYLRHAKRYPFVLVPDHLVKYRVHAGQNSLNVGQMERSARRMISREFDQSENSQQSKQLRNESFNTFYTYLRAQCLRNLSSPEISLPKTIESVWVLALTQLHSRTANKKSDLKVALRALVNSFQSKKASVRRANGQTPFNTLSFEPDLVSVIIPTYNRAPLLVEAIESIRRQTWNRVQIIVVDDGSSDETRAKIEPMTDVNYFWQSNKGQAAARNTGLKVARGEFICTLDSDDLWQPKFLQESIEALRQLDVDFVFSNWFRQNADGSVIRSYFEEHVPWWTASSAQRKHWRIFEPESIRELVQWICVAPSSAFVFRRSQVVRGWQESVKVTDDWALLQDIVITNPCRVGAFMTRAWVKRVKNDNVCDVETTRVTRALGIDSPKRLVRDNYASLTRHERCRIYRRLAVQAYTLLGLEPKSARNLKQGVSDICVSLTLAFLNAPLVFLTKIFYRNTWTFLVPPSEALRSEELLEPPSALQHEKYLSQKNHKKFRQNRFPSLQTSNSRSLQRFGHAQFVSNSDSC